MAEPPPPPDPAARARSVQRTYAPACQCFGCGPANEQGLRLESFLSVDGEELVARFRPAAHHLAYDGMVNGGIIGALLDCHSNWTAAITLMRRTSAAEPPCTVTSEFHVTLSRPTPLDAVLELRAKAIEVRNDRVVVVDATLGAGGVTTATCRGTFVAVREGHPAYHRW